MKSIVKEIERLKKEKNAVIFAHFYCTGEIQAIADYVGDSYFLAKKATEITAQTVVFCGVSFMGESVKILNPFKTVLMPDLNADCAMAHMAQVEIIERLRKEYDDLAVVCYINSSAKLKCHSDVCVTSSNALKIVERLPNKNIFFIPDGNLGRFVKEKVTDKNVILNDGCCPVHARIEKSMLDKIKREHPNALVLTHPECREEIVKQSDYIGSTAEIIEFANKSDKKEFIICTENGVEYPLKRDNPDKEFYFVTDDFVCADMKLNTLEKVLHVLKTGENQVLVDEELRQGAMKPLDKMLEMAR